MSNNYDSDEKPTGLLTRFVPSKLRNSSAYRWFLRFTRVFQFLSAIVSLGIFSSRMYKVYRLVNSIKTRRGVNGSYDAVEGILAAAVLYTLIAMIFGCIKKNSSPGTKSWLRWLWVLLDLAFVGAFIAVAVLTSPKGGLAGPKHCYANGQPIQNGSNSATGQTASKDDTCNLPWGAFILAILSTLLHAITAAFHEVRDHHKRNKLSAAEKATNERISHDGFDNQGGGINGQAGGLHGHGAGLNGRGVVHNGDGSYASRR